MRMTSNESEAMRMTNRGGPEWKTIDRGGLEWKTFHVPTPCLIFSWRLYLFRVLLRLYLFRLTGLTLQLDLHLDLVRLSGSM